MSTEKLQDYGIDPVLELGHSCADVFTLNIYHAVHFCLNFIVIYFKITWVTGKP